MTRPTPSVRGAFTLIEIMIVVGILAVILGMAAPSVIHALKKEGMRKVVSDVVEACSHARAQAILKGVPTELIIRPADGTLQVTGSAPDPDQEVPANAVTGFSARIPAEVAIEMLDVNFVERKDDEFARVRFYPNGTCDEFTIILRSPQREFRKISLELVTALPQVEILR